MSIRKKNTGSPPGSIIFTGKRKVEQVSIHYTEYNDKILQERLLNISGNNFVHEQNDLVVQWYDIKGLHDEGLIAEIGKIFQINSLFLEDVVDTAQRPKFEEIDQGFFLVAKSLTFYREHHLIKPEQVGIYAGKGFALTFQESESDLFLKIRDRMQTHGSRIRKQGADYLVYSLLDWIVDNYFLVLEDIQSSIEQLEEEILQHPSPEHKSTIHQIRRGLIKTRKAIAPLREAISKFAKSDSELISQSTIHFLRDLQDHTIQLVDSIDTNREMLNSLQDLYLSEISFKMNQVMQVLTIITTIFVPLSFLVGLYGMNFDYMPELHYRYGYFILLFFMGCIVTGLTFFFKKKNWF